MRRYIAVYVVMVLLLFIANYVVVHAEGDIDDFSGGLLDGLHFSGSNAGYRQYESWTIVNITDNNITTGTSFSKSHMFYVFSEPVVIRSLKVYKSGNISCRFYKLDEKGNHVLYKWVDLYEANGVPNGVTVEMNLNDLLADVPIVGIDLYSTGGTGSYVKEFNVYSDLLGVDSEPPGEVTNLQSAVVDNDVTLTWSNPVDEDFSHVKIYRDGVLIEGNWTSSSYVDTDLEYRTYEYRIVAVDENGNESDGVVISVDVVVPVLPVDDISSLEYEVGMDYISFTWVNPADNFKRVDVYRNGQKVYETTLNSFVNEGLQPGTLYNYRFVVVGLNDEESSGVQISLQTLEEVDEEPPGVPQNVVVVPLHGRLYVRWDMPFDSDLYGFNVYLDGVRHNQEIIRTNYYEIRELEVGVEYAVEVTSVDFAGNESGRSAVVYGVPVEQSIPSLNVGFDLGSVADSIGNWFSGLWPILAFSVGIPIAFVVGQSLKKLFVEDND